MSIISKENLRAEFHRLRADEAAITQHIAPLEAKYAAASEQAEKLYNETVRPLAAQLKPEKAKLHAVQMELSEIVRFLRGSNGIADTGDAPVAAADPKKK